MGDPVHHLEDPCVEDLVLAPRPGEVLERPDVDEGDTGDLDDMVAVGMAGGIGHEPSPALEDVKERVGRVGEQAEDVIAARLVAGVPDGMVAEDDDRAVRPLAQLVELLELVRTKRPVGVAGTARVEEDHQRPGDLDDLDGLACVVLVPVAVVVPTDRA